MRKIFITGTATNVGKTIVSAVLTEALEADYWKPIQAGNLSKPDTDLVRQLVSNPKSVFHPEAYRFTQPLPPPAAAAKDGVSVEMSHIKARIPFTLGRDLVIEGTGGVMSPVDDSNLEVDLITALDAEAVVVSKNYPGSVNHALLTLEALKRRGLPILGIIFNGDPLQSLVEFIIRHSGIKLLGFVYDEKIIDRQVISRYARVFRRELSRLT